MQSFVASPTQICIIIKSCDYEKDGTSYLQELRESIVCRYSSRIAAARDEHVKIVMKL